MSEINAQVTSSQRKKSGGKRSKILSTRVDLTPMVDLGFLLITFFIFTTTLSLPKAMHLYLPKDSKDPNLSRESATLTLIPSGNDRLYSYEGIDLSKMQSASYNSLRAIIQNKRARTNPSDFMIIIKPTSTCSYKNTVALLDEMIINQVKRYALVDISRDDTKWLSGKEQ